MIELKINYEDIKKLFSYVNYVFLVGKKNANDSGKEPIFRWTDPKNHLRSASEVKDKVDYVTKKYGYTVTGVGIPCKQNDLIVIDIDEQDKRKVKKMVKKLPETLTFKTAKGYHFVYKAQGQKIGSPTDNKKKRKWGFDLRGPGATEDNKGGYIVAPGSIHPSGVMYTIKKDIPPTPISVQFIEEYKKYCSKIIGDPIAYLEELYPAFFDAIHDNRNSTVFMRLSDLWNSGLFDFSQMEEISEHIFVTCVIQDNSAPYLRQELTKTLNSICRKDPTGVSLDKLTINFYERTPQAIAKLFINEKYQNNLIIVGEGHYFYNGTHWEYIHRTQLDNEIQRFIFSIEPLTEHYKAHQKNLNTLIASTIAIVKRYSLPAFKPFSTVDEQNKYLNFKNGVMRLCIDGATEWIQRNDETKNKLRDLYLQYTLPFDYEKENKECPLFDQYLKTIIENRELGKSKSYMLELMSYAVIPFRPVPYFLILHGVQHTGKSTFWNILKTIVGDEAISTTPINDMVSSRFGTSSLQGKILYIEDDMPDNFVIPGGFIKKISGDGFLTIERKGEQPVTVSSSIFPILLSNTPPRNTGTDGIERRALVLKFDKKIENRDINFLSKLSGRFPTSRDERPAIMNLLIKAWKRLYKRDFYFDAPEWLNESRSKWLQEGNSVEMWKQECFAYDQSATDELGWYKGTDIYTSYHRWCKDAGMYPLGRNNFYNALRSDPEIEEKKRDGYMGFVLPCYKLNNLETEVEF